MTLCDLKEAGFSCVGLWRRSADGVAVCEGNIPGKPGLYLFVVKQEIRYVGSALQGLDQRMQSYKRRQNNSTSERPIHKALAASLDKSESVEVYVREIDSGERCNWGGLPVSVILGVEAALIADLNPSWNRRGHVLILDEKIVAEETHEFTS